MDVEELKDFVLSQQLVGHQKAVRCVCVLRDGRLVTGDLDGNVILWRRAEVDHRFHHERSFTHHTNFVYAVCGSEITAGGGVFFYTGGYDKRVCRVSVDGTVVNQYKGHDKAVNSLVEFGGGTRLVSGSWDGTAKVWNVETEACEYTMPGHTHAVCVAILPNGEMVTGSQDKAIRFWQDGRLVRTIEGAHEDIVRAFTVIKQDPSAAHALPFAFLSASNDCHIKAWGLDGTQLGDYVDHTAFIFDVKASSVHVGRVFSGGDDKLLKVWDVRLTGEPAQQSILHAGTVWQVCELPNGDVVSCCEDGVVRVWTTHTHRMASEDERELQKKLAHDSAAEEMEKRATPAEFGDLRDVSEINSVRGSRVGQTGLFKEGNLVVAYQWTGSKWERIGEVVGKDKDQQPQGAGGSTISVGDRMYEGDQYFPAGQYDAIWPVEIGSGGSKARLPFRIGDNPLVVAEKFIAREGLGKQAVEQVASFIRQHAATLQPAPRAPPTQTQPTSAAPPSAAAASSAAPTSQAHKPMSNGTKPASKHTKHFPIQQGLIFKTSNVDAMHKKLVEFDEQLPEGHEGKMTDIEKVYLREAMARFKHAKFLDQEFRNCEMDLFFKKFPHWPLDKHFPVMDLWRAYSLHPQSTDMHKGSDEGWHLIVHAMKTAKADPNGNAGVFALRYMANLFHFPTNKYVMMRRRQQVLDGLADAELAASTNKNVRIAFATILCNYAELFQERPDPEGEQQLVSLIGEHLSNETDPESFYRSCVALGSCLVKDASLGPWCRDLEIGVSLTQKSSPFPASEQRCRDIAADILKLIPPP
ncbi:unnamed protein product [Vitrella brassicaformis CCMP3155]|uniref:PUL domain-containing protein n=2 Tax=Vitrella brassicaformis TaxID=1169539 RepID=A0A0G4H1U7_VITBC|nr:unnamed protein product [Vitrella brassicaformis CCMP3155]|eukprot:CEM37601.1 unnamed protein product [Vitrella brassicaformis CCMP3155]